MSYMLITENPNGTREQYDQVLTNLGANSDDFELPDGCLNHTAGPLENGGWCIVSEWESKEDFEAFLENRLKPAMGDQPTPQIQPKWFQVYNQYGSLTGGEQGIRRAA